jgi:hypothetical protein
MKKQIAKFLGGLGIILSEYSIAQLEYFLKSQLSKGVMSLGGIPGAFLPKQDHNIEKLSYRSEFFFLSMHKNGCLRVQI